jgi:hypothetical protein
MGKHVGWVYAMCDFSDQAMIKPSNCKGSRPCCRLSHTLTVCANSLAGHLVGQVPGIAGSGFRQAEALFELADDGFDPLANPL